MNPESVQFYIVATPIGNLGDMTYRAVDLLKKVDVILCEDTRTTKHLTDYYHIETPRESYHANSTDGKEESIVRRIGEGTTFALVSDAGTPTISDPGVKLVARIRDEYPDIPVVSIPGASAVITALAGTGFSGNDFRFFGFAPHKKGRQGFFADLASHQSVAVFYESPHRLMKTLEQLAEEIFDKRQMCVARELTKNFEEFQFGTGKDLLAFFNNHPEKVRGEFVILLARQG